MKHIINIICLILLLSIHNSVFAQIGAGPTTNCSFPPGIPEICGGGSYPASTTGTATALGASFSCPGTSPINGQPAFFFFEVGTAGDINLYMEPVDPITGALLTNDLDFIAWGPFASTNNMCTQLQAINRVDCSYSAASAETCVITGANVGDFYVILVSNWHASNTPDPCNILFTADTTFGAVGNPFAGGGFAGDNNTINPCSTEPPFDLVTGLNNQPDDNGYWVNESNDPVNNIFDPAIDTAGIYTYIIPGSTNCPGDTAYLTINLLNGNSLSITSPNSVCIGDMPITLTATPSGGSFIGPGISGNTLNTNTPGSIEIEYVYQSGGCSDTVKQNLTIHESPTVLSTDVITTNPLCYGEASGTALITASGGLPNYSYNWYGENNLALTSGTFTYTVTDANSCTYTGDVTLYDPQNNLAILSPYNSSCFGADDGSIGITVNNCIIPPGNVSTLGYCTSSPNATLSAQPSAIIEEVILIGDNNDINNNTAGAGDVYEDYTASMYADIEAGQSYTISVTLNGIGATGNSVNNSGGKVFIDYNVDGDFDDPDEEIGIISYRDNTNIGIPETITFTVPTTYGAYGPTRMRVVSQYRVDQDPSLIGPCDAPAGPWDQPWYGATEDYSIVINCPNSSTSFLWEDGQTTDSITGLSPGIYVVTITPSNGCAVQDSAEIIEPEQIVFNPEITHVSCNSFMDGEIIIDNTTISGGAGGPYTVDWGSNNPLALGAGTYNVTVSDPSTITSTNPNACENDTNITINEPEYFSVNFTTSSNEICFNDIVSLDFDFNQGGVAPYTVNYTENSISQPSITINNNGNNSIDITPSVGNNTYIITNIIDDDGCINQNIIPSQNIYVNPLPDINISVAPSPICEGQSATLIFSSSIGSAPFTVDYYEESSLKTVTVPSAGLSVIVNPDDTTKYTLNYVTDDEGCESNLDDEAILIVNEIPQLTTSYPNEFCEGENIEIDIQFTAGVPPFNIDYIFNGTPTSTVVNNLQATLSFVSTNPTNIEITNITSNICNNVINESITVTTNPLPVSTISGTYELCDDPINPASVDVMISTTEGSPLYDIFYTNGDKIDSIINATSTITFNTSDPGIYTLTKVVDSKGCESIDMNGFATVIIHPLPDASITAYPIQAEINDAMIYFTDESVNHVSGLWNFDDGETRISNLKTINHVYRDTGTYQVSLTTISPEGCENTAYQTIIISPIFQIYIPNAFTPNNDLYNDHFMPILDGVEEFEMNIYNRAGEKFFTTDTYSNQYCVMGCDAAWDGTKSNGEYANTGVYIYNILVTDINGKKENIEGSFKLIR